MSDKNYLNEAGVFRCKSNGLIFKDATAKGGKPAIYKEFQRLSDGAICAMRFNRPADAKDAWKIMKALAAFGQIVPYDVVKAKPGAALAALGKHKDKEVNVYVAPWQWKGKTMYSAQDLFAAEHKAYGDCASAQANPLGELGDDLGDLPEPLSDDPFGAPPAALQNEIDEGIGF